MRTVALVSLLMLVAITHTRKSYNEPVATVDANGLVTAVGSGTATFSATAPGGASDAAVITVQLTPPVAYVTVTPGGAAIAGVGNTTTFSAQAYDAGDNQISGLSYTWSSLNPNVATINASTGQVTAVAAGQVTIGSEAGGVLGHAVITVTTPGLAIANLWYSEPSPADGSFDLAAVWGTSSNEVFVIDNQTVLRYDGSSWSIDAAGMPTGWNWSVWGLSSDDVYITGVSSIMHFDGSQWTRVREVGAIDIWGPSPDELYVTASLGIHRHTGVAWDTVYTGAVPLNGIWGTSASEIWAVGQQGTVLRYDGSNWSGGASTAGTTRTLEDVWGTSPNDVFVVGDGVVLHWNGAAWTSTAVSPSLYRVWGAAPNDVYAVGFGGYILHYNGSNWTQLANSGTQYLAGIWGIEPSPLFAVGTMDGPVFRGARDGSVTVTPDPYTLTAIAETVQLAAAAADAGSNPISGVTFTWSSDNEPVATVDANGLVTAVGSGTATISATAPGGASGTAAITVQ